MSRWIVAAQSVHPCHMCWRFGSWVRIAFMWERFITPRLGGRMMAGRSFLDRFELFFISPTRIKLRIEYISSELILYFSHSFFHFFLPVLCLHLCLCTNLSFQFSLVFILLLSGFIYFSLSFLFVSIPLYQPFSLIVSFLLSLLLSVFIPVVFYALFSVCICTSVLTPFINSLLLSSCLSISLYSCRFLCFFVVYL